VAKKKKSGVTTPIYLPPTTKNVLRVKRLVAMVRPTDMPTMTPFALAAVRHHCGRRRHNQLHPTPASPPAHGRRGPLLATIVGSRPFHPAVTGCGLREEIAASTTAWLPSGTVVPQTGLAPKVPTAWPQRHRAAGAPRLHSHLGRRRWQRHCGGILKRQR
jgi:hypothetical protein